MAAIARPVFRFAPSPNGFLHAGHACSALLNAKLARQGGGTMLLRIEDIDVNRCTRAYEDAIVEDLHWLGLEWPQPARRQSDHLSDYARAQARLAAEGLVFPCFCTRGDISREVADRKDWPRDPDGSPLYPGTCRALSDAVRRDKMANTAHALRLDMVAAVARVGPLHWREWAEDGVREIAADPTAWGDIVLARRDIGTSYHIAVVVDDALQGVTHVVRGMDLCHATSVHRLLQALLELPAPLYRHHALLRDEAGDKLAKSRASTPLRALRERGMSADEVRAISLSPFAGRGLG